MDNLLDASVSFVDVYPDDYECAQKAHPSERSPKLAKVVADQYAEDDKKYHCPNIVHNVSFLVKIISVGAIC